VSHSFKPSFKLGILGGGQLARMLALSAHKWGVEPWIYSENPNDPGRQVSSFGATGKLDDAVALKKFLSQVDIATFESEFLNAPMLAELQKSTGTPISPSPEIMGLFQDRLSQKQLLDKMKIPTAKWMSVNTPADAQNAAAHLSLPLVFKKRRFGYDGYGTFVIRDKKSLQDFCDKEFPNADGFIVEQFIPFKRELACIFARSQSGEIVHYPLVESLQKDSRCFWVKGPVKQSSFKPWTTKFKKLLAQTKYVGVIGVELFETKKGLIVNELAPRVHNSGHYTQDAFELSQFDLHILALLDQPIFIPPSPKGFAMVNLLGDSNPTGQANFTPNTFVHWYGKADSRPGRKMGHINALGTTPAKALQTALKARKRFSI
jgi:5-(carboxyamino)imidazole ribonucleotide synthase